MATLVYNQLLEPFLAHPKTYAWAGTTALTTAGAYFQSDYFIDTSTNLRGILLACVINGLALTLLHSVMEKVIVGAGSIQKQTDEAEIASQNANIALDLAESALLRATHDYDEKKAELDRDAEEKKAQHRTADDEKKAAEITLARVQGELHEIEGALEETEETIKDIEERKRRMEETKGVRNEVFENKSGEFREKTSLAQRLERDIDRSAHQIAQFKEEQSLLELAHSRQLELSAKRTAELEGVEKKLRDAREALEGALKTIGELQERYDEHVRRESELQGALEDAVREYDECHQKLLAEGGSVSSDKNPSSRTYKQTERAVAAAKERHERAVEHLEQRRELFSKTQAAALQSIEKHRDLAEKKGALEEEKRLVETKIAADTQIRRHRQKINEKHQGKLAAAQRKIDHFIRINRLKIDNFIRENRLNHALQQIVLEGTRDLTPRERVARESSFFSSEKLTPLGELEDLAREKRVIERKIQACEQAIQALEESTDAVALRTLRERKDPPHNESTSEQVILRQLTQQLAPLAEEVRLAFTQKQRDEGEAKDAQRNFTRATDELAESAAAFQLADKTFDIFKQSYEKNREQREALAAQLVEKKRTWEEAQRSKEEHDRAGASLLAQYHGADKKKKSLEAQIAEFEASLQDGGLIANATKAKDDAEEQLRQLSEQKFKNESALRGEEVHHEELEGQLEQAQVKKRLAKEEMDRAGAEVERISAQLREEIQPSLDHALQEQTRQTREKEAKEREVESQRIECEEKTKTFDALDKDVNAIARTHASALQVYQSAKDRAESDSKARREDLESAQKTLHERTTEHDERQLKIKEWQLLKQKEQLLAKEIALITAQQGGGGIRFAHQATKVRQARSKFLLANLRYHERNFHYHEERSLADQRDVKLYYTYLESQLKLKLAKYKKLYHDKFVSWDTNKREKTTERKELTEMSEYIAGMKIDLARLSLLKKKNVELQFFEQEDLLFPADFSADLRLQYQQEQIYYILEHLIEVEFLDSTRPFQVSLSDMCREQPAQREEASHSGGRLKALVSLLISQPESAEAESGPREKTIYERLQEAIQSDNESSLPSSNLIRFLEESMPGDILDSTFPSLQKKIELLHLLRQHPERSPSKEQQGDEKRIAEKRKEVLTKEQDWTQTRISLLKIGKSDQKNPIVVSGKKGLEILSYALPPLAVLMAYTGIVQKIIEPIAGEISWEAGKRVCEITAVVHFIINFRPDWIERKLELE